MATGTDKINARVGAPMQTNPFAHHSSLRHIQKDLTPNQWDLVGSLPIEHLLVILDSLMLMPTKKRKVEIFMALVHWASEVARPEALPRWGVFRPLGLRRFFCTETATNWVLATVDLLQATPPQKSWLWSIVQNQCIGQVDKMANEATLDVHRHYFEKRIAALTAASAPPPVKSIVYSETTVADIAQGIVPHWGESPATQSRSRFKRLPDRRRVRNPRTGMYPGGYVLDPNTPEDLCDPAPETDGPILHGPFHWSAFDTDTDNHSDHSAVYASPRPIEIPRREILAQDDPERKPTHWPGILIGRTMLCRQTDDENASELGEADPWEGQYLSPSPSVNDEEEEKREIPSFEQHIVHFNSAYSSVEQLPLPRNLQNQSGTDQERTGSLAGVEFDPDE